MRPSSSSLLLCIHSRFGQRESCARDALVLLAEGAGSLVFDLLVECIAVADGGDVIALSGVSSRCGGCLAKAAELRALRTIPPGVAAGYAKAWRWLAGILVDVALHRSQKT